MKEIVWVCEKCGSKDVETRQWVDVNTEKIMWGLYRIDRNDTWCRICEDHEGCITEEEYKETQVN